MTREEEIRQEIDLQLAGSFGSYSEGYEEGFIEGAKWADRTMIEKACKWLLKGGYFVNNTETINDIKKAMEL